MQTINRLLPLAIILPMLSVSAHAQIRTMGVDRLTCADWNADRASELTHAGEYLWLLGYVSGAATATGKNILRDWDPRHVEAAMTVECGTNPSESFADAARSVLRGFQTVK